MLYGIFLTVRMQSDAFDFMLPEYIVMGRIMHTDSKYVSAENVLLRNDRDTDACPDMCQDARCGPGVKHSGDIYGCFACTFLSHSSALMCGIMKPQWLFKIQKIFSLVTGSKFFTSFAGS